MAGSGWVTAVTRRSGESYGARVSVRLTARPPAPPEQAGPAAGTSAPAADGPPRRSGGGILTLPPWTRAPLLPWRQPAVILAVVAAAAILACAGASAALFLSSASSESLRRIIAADCPDGAYAAVTVTRVGTIPQNVIIGGGEPGRADVPDATVRDALTGAGFADPYRVRVDDRPLTVHYDTPPAVPERTRFVYADGALAHTSPVLERGRPVSGPGVWVPERVAQQRSLRPGSTLRLDGPTGRPAGVRVVGVYRNLFEGYDNAYWCSYTGLFLGEGTPSPLLVTDAATFATLRDRFAGSSTDTWVSPVDTRDLTLTRASDLAARQVAAYRAAGFPPPEDFGSANAGPGQLPAFTHRTDLIRAGLRGPVLPIALGGSLLALLLVGAAGSYWADRRAREIRLLGARGVGPGPFALKAALELAVPALAGTVLGWFAARWLVAGLGPSSVLDAVAPWQAAWAALAGLVAGLALLALVAGLRSRAATERPIGARRSRLALVPWEVFLLAAAAACFQALRGGGAVRLDDNIAQVSTLVVAFPLLFLVGGAILLVRLLAAVLPWLARRSARFGPAAYLAANRIAGARMVSVVLLAAAGAPIAMVVYAAGMTGTATVTLDAKARVIAGADLAVLTVDPLRRTPATDAAGTVVVRYLYGKVEGQNDDVAVLAVDPDSFARTAYWDRRFGPVSLDELMARLREPAPAGEIPAVVVRDGPRFPDRFPVGLGTTRITARTVGSADLFPGRRLRQPMMIVDRSRLPAIDPYAGTTNELWTNGDPAAARAALQEQDAAVFFAPKDRAAVFDTANFVGVSWTFGYLTALAALVGLVAVGGLLLYLETRQRTRVASYALGRRMGLTRRTHLRSLVTELAALAVPAWAIGTGLAWTAVLLVHGLVDIDPGRPPASLLTVPVGALVGSAVAVAVVVVLAALYAQRAADRTRAAEVLRLG